MLTVPLIRWIGVSMCFSTFSFHAFAGLISLTTSKYPNIDLRKLVYFHSCQTSDASRVW